MLNKFASFQIQAEEYWIWYWLKSFVLFFLRFHTQNFQFFNIIISFFVTTMCLSLFQGNKEGKKKTIAN